MRHTCPDNLVFGKKCRTEVDCIYLYKICPDYKRSPEVSDEMRSMSQAGLTICKLCNLTFMHDRGDDIFVHIKPTCVNVINNTPKKKLMEKQEIIMASGEGTRPVGGNGKDRVVREPNKIPWLPILLSISFLLPSATSISSLVLSFPTQTLLEATLRNQAYDLRAGRQS